MSPAPGVRVVLHSLPLPLNPAPGLSEAPQHTPGSEASDAAAAVPAPSAGQTAPESETSAGWALAVGSSLGDYRIEAVLAARGTTVVYRATCMHSEAPQRVEAGQTVVVKEYLPPDLAQRSNRGAVAPRDARMAPAYALGLQAFVDEAHLLAGCEHAALAPVLHFWQQNGTAYQVLPLFEGVSLSKWLADLGTPPSETWLHQMLQPLLQGLAHLHAQQRWHGALSADNIWLLADPEAASYLEQRPRPVLLGLDAARRALAQATQNADSLLASGLVSVEMSDGPITARLGPWTDVYGLCAVLYTAVVGRAPLSPMSRLLRDDMVSARKLGRGRYSNELLAAIDAGLVVQPAQRTQNMAEFQAQLVAPAAVLHAVPTSTVPALPRSLMARTAAGATSASGDTGTRGRWVWAAALGALLLLLALAGALFRH